MSAAEGRRTEALLRWYERAHRPLPWRATRDPWALLVSEVMLQQTPAARVVGPYEAFLARFPGPSALAGAPVGDTLRAWSGLGYNRRALALRRAAAEVAERGWPRDAAGLAALPGVGPYTAAAVASFAWDEPVAAVDTNVRRVIARWDGVERGPAALRRRAAELLPHDRSALFNQAMMELGATVCRARRADCAACPAFPCATRGAAVPVPARRGGPRVAFAQTDRFLRGRVVAALATGGALPSELHSARGERVLAGLERDGLVVRRDGRVALP